MTQEVWLPIPGFEGSYEVSNLGRVKSIARLVDHGYPIKSKEGCNLLKSIRERILRPSISKRGYHWVYLRKDGKTCTHSVHTLVLCAFRGPRPGKLQGRHLDGDPYNNTPENLRWGTAKRNQRDRIIHGTDDRGEKSANAKLTWKDVEYIRSSSKSQQQLADELNVSQATVSDARRHITWK